VSCGDPVTPEWLIGMSAGAVCGVLDDPTGSAIEAIVGAAYGIMRFLLELMRTDTTFRFLGLSRNGWVALGVTIAGGVLCWWLRGDPVADAEQDEVETEETADTGFGEE
jgi:hypothetical protein